MSGTDGEAGEGLGAERIILRRSKILFCIGMATFRERLLVWEGSVSKTIFLRARRQQFDPRARTLEHEASPNQLRRVL